jgi:pyrimidine-nucleoside phosphorylase
LKALGYAVPKLGVPGRPAGGIDVLAQIPGYKIDFTLDEIEYHLKNFGFIHFLAGESFAPLDATLFSYRRKVNKVNIPELAIASLLSKKLAAAVSLVGLDVRVASHGNFGTSFDIASAYSKRFCLIASQVGIQARCFLSNANSPYQPYIGRGEALVAVHNVITNQADLWLRSHNDACYAMVNRLIDLDTKCGSLPRPNAGMLSSVFRKNLAVQGSSFGEFERYVDYIKNEHSLKIHAPIDGFLRTDLNLLRSLIVDIQNQYASGKNRFPDPCGIILKYPTGTFVCKGDVLATIRCEKRLSDEMLTKVNSSVRLTNEPIENIFFLEVNNG